MKLEWINRINRDQTIRIDRHQHASKEYQSTLILYYYQVIIFRLRSLRMSFFMQRARQKSVSIGLSFIRFIKRNTETILAPLRSRSESSAPE